MSYQLYKPLRNHLRQYALFPSLRVIWAYMQHLQFKAKMPDDIQFDPAVLLSPNRMTYIVEWELAILAKELILHAPPHSPLDFRSWNSFSASINKIKDLDNNISKDQHYGKLVGEKILLHVYRLAHQQFHWQRKPNGNHLARYFKIFSHPEVDPIIEAEYGIETEKMYFFALAMMGMYMKTFSAAGIQDYEKFGIRKEVVLKLVDRLSSDVATLRSQIEEYQSYDQDFPFTLNPLVRKPLIKVPTSKEILFLCPIPTYLFTRLTEGIYYDICNHRSFANAFGSAFQSYIGDVIDLVAKGTGLKYLPEQNYFVGKDRKASIDWIAMDDSATLFIECKSKKVRYEAKISLADTTVLDEDLDKMAEFIVQAYKTMVDSEHGLYPHWKPDQKPVFPLIVTLENWHILGPELRGALNSRVESSLNSLKIDTEILERSPYSICSTEELEHAMYVMSRAGINNVMKHKNEGAQKEWGLMTILHNYFREELRKSGNLFPDPFKIPALES